MNTEILQRAGIDYKAGLNRFLDDKELYESVLTAFLTDTCLDRAQQAMDSGDRAELFASIHAVKGSSGNADMTRLYFASSELVACLRQKDETDEDIAELFGKFRDAYLCARNGIRDALEAR